MMKLKRSIFYSFLLFSQISCQPSNQEVKLDSFRAPANEVQLGSLSGKVMDNDNDPIAGAKITISEEGQVITTSVTDDEGNYKVMGLPSRDYSVNAAAEGFTGDTYMVRVDGGEEGEYIFTLSP